MSKEPGAVGSEQRGTKRSQARAARLTHREEVGAVERCGLAAEAALAVVVEGGDAQQRRVRLEQRRRVRKVRPEVGRHFDVLLKDNHPCKRAASSSSASASAFAAARAVAGHPEERIERPAVVDRQIRVAWELSQVGPRLQPHGLSRVH